MIDSSQRMMICSNYCRNGMGEKPDRPHHLHSGKGPGTDIGPTKGVIALVMMRILPSARR